MAHVYLHTQKKCIILKIKIEFPFFYCSCSCLIFLLQKILNTIGHSRYSLSVFQLYKFNLFVYILKPFFKFQVIWEGKEDGCFPCYWKPSSREASFHAFVICMYRSDAKGVSQYGIVLPTDLRWNHLCKSLQWAIYYFFLNKVIVKETIKNKYNKISRMVFWISRCDLSSTNFQGASLLFHWTPHDWK